MDETVKIDFTGDSAPQFERVLIPADSYNCQVLSIEKKDTVKFGTTQKAITLLVKMKLADASAGTNNGKELAHFVNPIITKASKTPNLKNKKTYSNSKLYDLLADLGLLEEAVKRRDELTTIDGLSLFLSGKIVNRIVRASVITVNANTDNAHSVVAKILRFVG